MALLRKRISYNVDQTIKFGDDQDNLAERLAERMVDNGKAMALRSAEYLNWRYTSHPIYKYTSFIYREGGEQLGYMVARTADMIGHHVALVMDLWGLELRIERDLLQHIAAWRGNSAL